MTQEEMSEELPQQSSESAAMTKVYYHIDEETMIYVSSIPIPADKMTLGHFKSVLSRSNFKFYCKSNDPEVGGEVKAEIRDDNARLHKSANGRIELFLLTAEGSSHSDGSAGQKRQMVAKGGQNAIGFLEAANKFDQNDMSSESESAVSGLPNLPPKFKGGLNRRQLQPQFMHGHRNRRFGGGDESTMTSESDARMFDSEDDRSRVSTSTDITSVSRQHQNLYRRRRTRKTKFRQPSRASSFSSITESSMSLNIITVTLNMDTVNFLGISIVGQSSQRGDGGIYVANIMKGGAVALDGRIEAGDMILQVNEYSFENLTNDQAVLVLKDAVSRRGPIKLVVAKCWDAGPRSCFTIPRQEEPVRPIDTEAWIQHTNQMCKMPSIIEGSECTPTVTPTPQFRPPSSGTAASNNSGSAHDTNGRGQSDHLDSGMDQKLIVKAMAMPNSGLEIRNRTWLKIPIPMSFLGSDLVEWLFSRVHGLRDKKEARKYAAALLKQGYIKHVVKKVTFTEQCYYIFGDICAEFARLRLNGASEEGPLSEAPSVGPLPPPPHQYGAPHWPVAPTAPSMVSGYASMPSPFPQQYGALPTAPTPTTAIFGSRYGPEANCGHSQAGSNNSSGSDKKPFAVASARAPPPIAPKPATSAVSPATLEELPKDLASSRQSFRIAMNNPCEFFVDNL